ncbi:MAG: LysR family transcriptional regulator [Alcanivoracaceae bacterium]|nr:LysR family transcriptional regulator [Alcanivoracaceae bacterium]
MTRPLSSLNLLRTFEAAGRHLSFTLAAQELCITTSAVSQQMRKLEEELGITLFERQAKGLALTRDGERYWQSIHTHLNAIADSTRALTRERSITLRVSVMPPVASRVVLPRLADFQQQHPDIELHLDASLRYLDLQRDDIDLAIRFGTPPWPGCDHEKLLELSIQPVCPPALSESLQLAQHPERLAEAPLIQMTNRPDSWQQYFAFCGLGAITPAKQFFVDDYPAAIEAAETLGIALALAPLEKPLIDSGRLAAPWPAVGPLPEAVYAVMPQHSERHAQRDAFLDWLKQQLASLG